VEYWPHLGIQNPYPFGFLLPARLNLECLLTTIPKGIVNLSILTDKIKQSLAYIKF